MTRVLIRVRADGAVGQGHLGRCLPLAKAFRENAAEPYLAIESDSPHLGLIAAAGMQTLLQRSWAAADVAAAARELDATAIVLDVHDLLAGDVSALRDDSVPLASLSVVGEGVGLVDLLANPVAHAALALWPHLPLNPDLRILAGAEAAIVDWPRLAPLIGLEKDPGLVVLTLGGGDGHTHRLLSAAECLAAFPAITSIRVFIGKAFRRPDELRRRMVAIGERITVEHDSPDLPRALARARIAVCGYGTTLYEAAALGTPTVVVPLSATHEHFGRVAERQGFSQCLSWVDGVDEAGLRAAVSRFVGDGPFHQMACAAGAAAVSSGAARRVAEAVLTLPRLDRATQL